MAQIHHGQLQHLQQSLASVHAALEVKSEALSRAEAGRVRLRTASGLPPVCRGYYGLAGRASRPRELVLLRLDVQSADGASMSVGEALLVRDESDAAF